MSYSQNPFLVLSDNLLSTGIDDVTYRLKAAENKLKDTKHILDKVEFNLTILDISG